MFGVGVRGFLGGGGVLVGQDFWCGVDVLRVLPGIPLFWAVAPMRDRVF